MKNIFFFTIYVFVLIYLEKLQLKKILKKISKFSFIKLALEAKFFKNISAPITYISLKILLN